MLDLIEVCRRNLALRTHQQDRSRDAGVNVAAARSFQSALQSAGYVTCRLDGGMNRKQRDRAMEYVPQSIVLSRTIIVLMCGRSSLCWWLRNRFISGR